MSTYKYELINGIKPVVSDLGFFADIQFDPSDAQPTYIGLNATKGEPDDNLTWKLYKFTYSGSDVTRIQLAYSSWTNRASAF